MRWSKQRDNCANCGTDERMHVGHGLCTLCYRLMIKKKTAENWQLDNPISLKGYPFREQPINPLSFERLKKKVIQHYQIRLSYLKHREAKLKGNVNGLDLEYAFNEIASLAGSKDHRLFHGLCGWFEMMFSAKQRRALLKIADKIEKKVSRDINISSLLLK